MDKLIKPSFQTKPYDPQKVVRVRDRYQQYCYLKSGAYPVDLYESRDDVVMVFLKDETKELYKKWRNREFFSK